MQTTSTDDLINVYLADETKLYQDWYTSVQPQSADPDTTQKFCELNSLGIASVGCISEVSCTDFRINV